MNRFGATRRRAAVQLFRAPIVFALATLACFASARLAYHLAIPGGVVTLWLPSGVMLGLFLLSRRRDWPALTAATLAGSAASDLVQRYPAGFIAAAAFANALESLGIAWLITQRLPLPVRLATVRDVLELAALGIAGNLLTAIVGGVAMSTWFDRSFVASWLVWATGDGLSILILTPVFLVWRGTRAWAREEGPSALAAGGLLVAALVVVAEAALGSASTWSQPYMVFPLFFAAALRFGLRGAAIGTLIIALITVWNAALGRGVFITQWGGGVESAMQVYVFLGLASLASFILAAVLAERREAQRLMANSEGRYRSVVTAATDGIITIGTDDIIQFANPAVERIFGYTPAEMVGQNLTMLMPPELRERHRAGMQRYLVTGRPSIPWRAISFPAIHKDAREVPIEISFGELVDAGGARLFTGIIRDVSDKHVARQALQLAEERMRFALEAANVGVWEANLRSGSTYWSETCEVMHGLAPGSFGKTLDAFFATIHPDDAAHVNAEMAEAVGARRNALLEYRVRLPDGRNRLIRSTGHFFYDAHGTPVRGAGVVTDITEQRELEEQLRHSRKMDILGQLAGGVAHDFNNILTAIQGYGGIVLDQCPPDSDIRQDVGEILLGAQRAEALTRQLLAFSRRQILAPKVLDFGELVRHMQAMLKRLIGEHITIVVDAPLAACFVKADPGQLEQVVLNLVVNARDAMPDGGTVEISVRRVETAVALVVRDTGTGMSAATMQRMFEPFFTTKQPGKGTGLGLATVHGIVEQSGGQIDVASSPGQGTTFTITFPAERPVRPAAPERAAKPAGAGETETVLLVEDDDALRKLVQRQLQNAGYQVLAAPTPQVAIATAASSERIDLLLTDVVLPEKNGRELAQEIAATRPGITVLYMSGYTDDEIMKRGISEHDMEFVQKPFDQATLLQRVRETIEAAKDPSRGRATARTRSAGAAT